ncbi:hypothetical protein CCMA1212_003630 [Trichoderma ghanense]|uniref:Uncharacterized protein n=1 Tax=Trichoderma ghanense TaxID=65468 RepID=A0ABY2H865_9HYPO
MSTPPHAGPLPRLFKKAYSNLRRTRRFYLREASVLRLRTEDPRQLSRGLRMVAYELMKLSEHVPRMRELARECLPR